MSQKPGEQRGPGTRTGTAGSERAFLGRSPGPDIVEVEIWASERDRPRCVDNRMTAVGVGLMLGGFMLYLEGVAPRPVVPDEWIDLSLTRATAVSEHVYDTRDAAVAAVGTKGRGYYAYHYTIGHLTAPTVFSPATTPRICATAVDGFRRLGEETAHAIADIGVTMLGGKLIVGIVSKFPALASAARRWGARDKSGGARARRPEVSPPKGAVAEPKPGAARPPPPSRPSRRRPHVPLRRRPR